MNPWEMLNQLGARSQTNSVIGTLNAGTPPSSLVTGYNGPSARQTPIQPTYPAPAVPQPGRAGTTTSSGNSGGGMAGLIGGAGMLNWGIDKLSGGKINPLRSAGDAIKNWVTPPVSSDRWLSSLTASAGTPELGLEPQTGYGISVDTFQPPAVAGSGDVPTDGLGEMGGADFLNSPWLTGPAAALSLANFIRDPSIASGGNAALSGLGAANSIWGFMPAGFSTLPFMLPLLGMQLGAMFKPPKSAYSKFMVDENGKPMMTDFQGIKNADSIRSLSQKVMEALQGTQGLKPLMGGGPAPNVSYGSGVYDWVDDQSNPNHLPKPTEYHLQANRDDTNRVALQAQVPWKGTYIPHFVYSGAADPTAIANSIAGAGSVTQDQIDDWLRQWQEDQAQVKAAQNDYGH